MKFIYFILLISSFGCATKNINYDRYKIIEKYKTDYKYYLNDEDIYRQKVLESYGYQFIRINRFNSGKNPIETLDKRIKEVTLERANDKPWLDNLNRIYSSINSGQMRECPKCKELRMAQDFKDPKLETKIGRFCKFCKEKPRTSYRRSRGRRWRRY